MLYCVAIRASWGRWLLKGSTLAERTLTGIHFETCTVSLQSTVLHIPTYLNTNVDHFLSLMLEVLRNRDFLRHEEMTGISLTIVAWHTVPNARSILLKFLTLTHMFVEAISQKFCNQHNTLQRYLNAVVMCIVYILSSCSVSVFVCSDEGWNMAVETSTMKFGFWLELRTHCWKKSVAVASWS